MIVNSANPSVVQPVSTAVVTTQKTVEVVTPKTAENETDFFKIITDLVKGVNTAVNGMKEAMQTYKEIKGLAGANKPPVPPVVQPAPAVENKEKTDKKDNKEMAEFLDQMKTGFINHIFNCAASNPDMKISEILDTFPDPKNPFTAKKIADMITAARAIGVKI